MVQGLAFLSKKSWHTKNLSNQSKVWQAEQQKQAEDSKTKELARQIAQEREQEELDRISGKKTTIDRGIDWMYQGGTTGDLAKEDAARKAEEFLLGKEYVGPGAAQGDFHNGEEKEGINSVMNSKPMASINEMSGNAAESGSRYEDNEPSVKDRNENFRMRVEDPMFAVTQQQRAKVLKAEKAKALYEKVVGPTGTRSDSDEDSHRESKKRSKQERKKRKKKKRSRRDEDDDRKRRRRSRSRSNERRRKHRRRDRSRSHSRSRSESPHRREYYDDSRRDYRDSRDRRHKDSGRDYREQRGRDDERSSRKYQGYDDRDTRRTGRRSYSDDDHSQGSSHGYQASSRKRHDRRENGRSSDWNKLDFDHNSGGRARSPGKEQVTPRSEDGYGLQGGAKASVKPGSLGPDKDLLRKRREEKEAERRRNREAASSRRHVSSSDRARALEEMKADARRRDEMMTTKASSRRPDNDDSDEKVPERGRASFLQDMTKQTHGVGDGGMSLSDRVAQNRHTNQRSHDSFL